MLSRGSLKFPIALGVVLIVLVTALTVGWVLLTVFGASANEQSRTFYWILLAVGAGVFTILLIGIILFLALSIKATNLARRQSNFIDGVTHELKSPVASLKLYLQTLNRRQLSDDQRELFYRYMLADVERLDDLIDHLLDAARIKERQSDAKVEKVDLAALLTNCVKLACLRYNVPRECVAVELQNCLATVSREDVEIVFRNLIDNAVKYAGESPHVEVTLQFTGEQKAVVTIADNGPGIPRNLRRKIFYRFFRAGDELERLKPGTGLGLYLVQLLINRLRWKIRVRDARDGGAVFEVHLPALPAPPEHSSEEPQDAKEIEVA